MTNEWIYLFSSNAERKYVVDSLEVLAMPRGNIQHYRYHFKHINSGLRAMLEATPDRLVGRTVLVSYLCQEEYAEENQAKWRTLETYPLRLGTLVDADKLGQTAHLYFEVGDYVDYLRDRRLIVSHMQRTFTDKMPPASYAFSGAPLEGIAATSARDPDAFQAIVDAFEQHHLQTLRLKRNYVGSRTGVAHTPTSEVDAFQYDPIFIQILGLYRIQEAKGEHSNVSLTAVHPTRVGGIRDRAYRVDEENTHVMRANVYQPKWSFVSQLGAVISVAVDEKFFSTPATGELVVGSRYDSYELMVSAKPTEKSVWTYLGLRVRVPGDHPEVLMPIRTLWVEISPRRSRRLIQTLVDLSGQLGVSILPLAGTMWARDASPILIAWPWWFILGLLLALLKYLPRLASK